MEADITADEARRELARRELERRRAIALAGARQRAEQSAERHDPEQGRRPATNEWVHIRMPDGQVVRFPDTMTDRQISGLIASKYPREVGEIGASKPAGERDTSGHFSFDGSNIQGYDPETGTVPDDFDTSKSFAAGLRRGVEGLAGMAGEVGPTQGNLARLVAGKLGASPETQETVGNVASRLTPFPFAPTTEDVREKITNPIVGEAHQPQTIAGEYANSMGEFGTAALAPGGLIRKGLMATIPALASETSGQVTKGTAYEPIARAAGGIMGGLFVAPQTTGRAIAMAAKDTGVRTKAMTAIIRDMQRAGRSPDEIKAALANLGDDAALIDLPEFQQRGQRIYAKGGEGRQTIGQFLEPRDAGANARIRSEVDANLGPAPIPSKVDAGLRRTQRSLSPRYEAALGNAKAINTENIANDITSMIANTRGEARTALERVRDMLRIEGTEALDPHPRAALATRHAIDGMLKNTKDTNVQRILGDFRKRLDAELTQSVPGIKEVDAKFANLARQREAVDRGRTVLDSGRTSPVPAELADEVAKGGPAVKFRMGQGARAEIERIVGTNANDRVALQRIVKGEGDWNRQKLATLFGQDKADRIIKVLERESTFANTSNRVMKNSATAERLPLDEAGSGFGIREAAMAGGPKGAAYAAAIRLAEEAAARIGGKRIAARNGDIAKLLTSTERNRIATALIKANGGKAIGKAQLDSRIRGLLIAQSSLAQARQ